MAEEKNIRPTSKKKVTRRKVATVNLPVFGAIVEELFRFANKQQAHKQITALKQHFILAKDQEENQNPPSVKLWIKGFALTEDEIAKGYTGNFAMIRYRPTEEGNKFTLYAEKIPAPVSQHPQRKRKKQPHPDWGHYILRRIKKGETFQDIEEARALLMKLHEEYPETSIPLTNKLYLILYLREERPPTQKYVLEIKVREEGGFTIDATANTYESNLPKKASSKNAAKDKDGNTPGFFASKVALKRKRK